MEGDFLDKNPTDAMKIIQTSYKVVGAKKEIVSITLFRITGLRLRKKVSVRK